MQKIETAIMCAGGVAALAAAVGCTRQCLYQIRWGVRSGSPETVAAIREYLTHRSAGEVARAAAAKPSTAAQWLQGPWRDLVAGDAESRRRAVDEIMVSGVAASGLVAAGIIAAMMDSEMFSSSVREWAQSVLRRLDHVRIGDLGVEI